LYYKNYLLAVKFLLQHYKLVLLSARMLQTLA